MSKKKKFGEWKWMGAAVTTSVASVALTGAFLSMAIVPAQAANTTSDLSTIVENTSNHILNGVIEGDVKKGGAMEDLYESVPDAFVVPDGVKMGMVHHPETPASFSLCIWKDGVDGIGASKAEALAYRSAADAFSPMEINCEPAGANAIDLQLSSGNIIPASEPKRELLDFETVAPSNPAPVQEAPVEVAPVEVVEEEEPAEPVVIPWGAFAIVGLILGCIIAILIVIWAAFKITTNIRKTAHTSQNNVKHWEQLVSRYDTVAKKWASYELDPVKILDFPLLSDAREQTTRDFHAAMRKAKHLRPADVRKMSTVNPNSSPFAHAVEALENAFHTAEVEAKRIRWNHFSADERKRLQRAKDLLNIAMNSAASEPERQAAYKRMQKEIEGLITVPEQTILALEEKMQLMLTDGTEDTAISLSK